MKERKKEIDWFEMERDTCARKEKERNGLEERERERGLDRNKVG